VWSRWWAGAGAVLAAALAAVFLAAQATPAAPGVHAGRAAAAVSAAHAARAAVAAPAVAPVPDPATQPLSGPVSGPVVALGDSYTAGDLMPLSLTAEPLGCLRSTASYAVRVAAALGASSDFVDAACTSAGVSDMTRSQHTYLGGSNPPQLSVLLPTDSVVMLTLGGDDLGFFNVLDKCMELSLTDLDGSPCEAHYTSGGTDQIAVAITAEAAKLTAVLQAIRVRAPRARVLFVGYPDLFPLHGGCWPLVPITAGDLSWLLGIEHQFNAMLSQAAAAAGVSFVDTYTPTIGHDFCQSARVKDVEGLIPTSLAAPFHVNARGQAALAAAVLAALRRG
jgi:lysophospholipase L1-like esterase